MPFSSVEPRGMGSMRYRRGGWAVGCACVVVAALVLLWPAERPAPTAPTIMDGLPPIDTRPFVEKQAVLDGLAAGSVTLGEAVDRCQELYREYYETTAAAQRQIEVEFAGNTPEE